MQALVLLGLGAAALPHYPTTSASPDAPLSNSGLPRTPRYVNTPPSRAPTLAAPVPITCLLSVLSVAATRSRRSAVRHAGGTVWVS
ncbi:hypothetical protein DFP73DRAFT_570553 [Morchella snyderi]|nr:hypothetical protein DFP73DRAFT_570553 [Morchella snyderi]